MSQVHRDLIITLAAQHKLPAVYQERNYVTAGGLISYGPNFVYQFRRAADYVDRILKGEKPADMPDGALLLVSDGTLSAHRDVIIALAARYRLPAVYPWRYMLSQKVVS